MLRRNRRFPIVSLLVPLLAGATAMYLPTTLASTTDPVTTDATCADHLFGSRFEIDPNANLAVGDATNCIDWLNAEKAKRTGVLVKQDTPSGTGDDAFGRGTSENDANPQIVDGSIPKNKSDLSFFGVGTESGSNGKFLQLFWSRVQNPSGTTNMDFELNKFFCDPTKSPSNCANNGKNFPAETPVRSMGDKLISYDLSNGGTAPTISIRTWSGSAWSTPVVISGSSSPTVGCVKDTTDPILLKNCALGSVNTSAIATGDSGGIGPLDPFTFGEASISYNALFSGNTCGTFGSAYLKSRSSDSFSAEIKDFIAPESVSISNCTTLTTVASSTTVGGAISDTAHLSGAALDAGGTITFKLFSDSGCQTEVSTGLTPVAVTGAGNYNSGNVFGLGVGQYYWIASYSGDANNGGSAGTCGDDGETSSVSKAPVAVSTTQKVIPQDSASIPGAAGTVTFSLYGPRAENTPPSCSGTPVVGPLTVNLINGTADTSNSIAVTASGTYDWLVSYSGDGGHFGTPGVCGAEHFTISITNSTNA